MKEKHLIGAFLVATLSAWLTTWADGTIMKVNREEAGLDLKTWTVIGNKYQLQCSTNLVSGTWENVGGEFTADVTSTNLNVETGAKSCWFRVVERKVAHLQPTSPPTPPPSEFAKPPSRPPPPPPAG